MKPNHAPVYSRISCCVALLCLLGWSVAAQEPTDEQEPSFTFEQVPIPGGSDVGAVVRIAQDSLGFLWLATQGGLLRYDGYTFTTFAHDPTDSTSISNNWVETVYVDRAGTLWAGTYGGGLNRFDPETQAFTRFRHDPAEPHTLSHDSVTVILEERDGTFWVGTLRGLNRMDRETGRFEAFHHEPGEATSLGNDQIRALYEDRSGTLWVGTKSPHAGETLRVPGPGGLHRFDPTTETFTRYLHDPNDPQTLIDNHVMGILEDHTGTFWVSSLGDGLHTMDRAVGTFIRHRIDPDHPEQLSRPFDPDNPDPTLNAISFLFEDRDGRVWMGAWGSRGINHYDPETGRLRRLDIPDELDSIWRMYQTADGTLWLAALNPSAGLWRVRPQRDRFMDLTYRWIHWGGSMAYDTDGLLWSGGLAETGLQVILAIASYKRTAGRYEIGEEVFSDVYGSLAGLASRRDGGLWVGTFAGTNAAGIGEVYHFDPASGTFNPAFDFDAAGRMGPIEMLYEDEGGYLWFGGPDAGLYRLHIASGDLVRFPVRPGEPGALHDDNVTVLYGAPSEPGAIWIGTEGGLYRFDRETETFTAYTPDPDDPTRLGSHRVSALYEDEAGVLWVGTQGGGLHAFDQATATFTRFTSYNSGLPDDQVLCLLGDEQGRLWLSTGAGITHFDPAERTFYTYTGADGPETRKFGVRACDAGPTGERVFGGPNGFTAFDPDRLETTGAPPPVVFTGLALGNRPVVPGPDGPLRAPLWRTEAITLDPDQHSFTVDAAALDYRDPDANRYAFMLDGYDEGWRETGTRRSISYVRVPPGDYTLRVRAANSQGVWSEEPTTLSLTIRPPWWRTTWAYGFYGLLFLAGVFAADRVQRRRLIARERERARERELEQAREIERAYHDLREAKDRLVQQEKLASLGQLTAGIAHEIKNPLNFINNFADLNEELAGELREAYETNPDVRLADLLDVVADLERNAGVIGQHGQRADGIVRAMMQHASGGTGRLAPTDLNALVAEYVDLAYHGRRAQAPGFEVDVRRDLDEAVGTVDVVAPDIGRVVLNLVGNAFDAVVSHQRDRPEPPDEEPSHIGETDPPTVTVATERVGDDVQIRVSDNGPGVPADLREKIFEPFYTTKPTGAGTGLGLSLSYDIVTQGHGGTLAVDGAEGEGATFVVTLPVNHRLSGSSD